jgi:hypothetical protein
MTPELEPSIHFEISAIVSSCGLLFIAAITQVGHPLWSVPAMILFALTALTLLCALPFASAARRFEGVTRSAT